jgi:nitrite reductase (NADH) small subunit/3-phenylpropionate/trans-cinnamate dioxygenase ferredoxin subunit
MMTRIAGILVADIGSHSMPPSEDSSTNRQAAGYVRALPADALAEGEGRTVEVAGRWIALFNIDGAFYALNNACPHMAGPLGAGRLEGHVVACPIHYWAFDVRTGCSPTNPQQRVASYDVRAEDGWVWVRFVR